MKAQPKTFSSRSKVGDKIQTDDFNYEPFALFNVNDAPSQATYFNAGTLNQTR